MLSACSGVEGQRPAFRAFSNCTCTGSAAASALKQIHTIGTLPAAEACPSCGSSGDYGFLLVPARAPSGFSSLRCGPSYEHRPAAVLYKCTPYPSQRAACVTMCVSVGLAMLCGDADKHYGPAERGSRRVWSHRCAASWCPCTASQQGLPGHTTNSVVNTCVFVGEACNEKAYCSVLLASTLSDCHVERGTGCRVASSSTIIAAGTSADIWPAVLGNGCSQMELGMTLDSCSISASVLYKYASDLPLHVCQ